MALETLSEPVTESFIVSTNTINSLFKDKNGWSNTLQPLKTKQHGLGRPQNLDQPNPHIVIGSPTTVNQVDPHSCNSPTHKFGPMPSNMLQPLNPNSMDQVDHKIGPMPILLNCTICKSWFYLTLTVDPHSCNSPTHKLELTYIIVSFNYTLNQ